MALTPEGIAFIANELIPALKSGDYKKGIGRLHRTDEDTWCCLGVACDIAEKLDIFHPVRAIAEDDNVETFDGERGYLPDELTKYLGMDHWGQFIRPSESYLCDEQFIWANRALTSINDANKTFNEVIEALEYIATHPDHMGTTEVLELDRPKSLEG